MGVTWLLQGAPSIPTARACGLWRLDLNAVYPLGQRWDLFGRVGNVTDRRYETAWGYPMPPRTVFVGVRWHGDDQFWRLLRRVPVSRASPCVAMPPHAALLKALAQGACRDWRARCGLPWSRRDGRGGNDGGNRSGNVGVGCHRDDRGRRRLGRTVRAARRASCRSPAYRTADRRRCRWTTWPRWTRQR
jgi:hypothetical protein